MFGNKIIDFIKNTKNTNGNDWFLGLTSDNQSEVKKAIKDYNKLIKTQGPDLNIDRWEQFSSLSDDVRTDVKTYLKSLDGAKASTEDLNKIMSATMETASSTGTEFVSTGNKIRDFGKKTTTVFKGFGNVVGNSLEKGLKTVGSTMLGIGANVAINAGAGLIISGLIDSWDKYTNAQENAIDRGNEAIQSYEDNLSKFNTNSQVISEVGERFEELRKGVSITGQNIGLTTDEYEEYQNTGHPAYDVFPDRSCTGGREGQAAGPHRKRNGTPAELGSDTLGTGGSRKENHRENVLGKREVHCDSCGRQHRGSESQDHCGRRSAPDSHIRRRNTGSG